MAPEHDCLDSLEWRSHHWLETHSLDCGPYERCYQEWYHCVICGMDYDLEEVERMKRTGADGR